MSYTKGKLKAKGGDIYIGEIGKGIRLVQMIPTGTGTEEANAQRLVLCWNSHDALLDACESWMKVESEMAANNPCPDYALRASYRKEAVRFTKAAIEAARKEQGK